MKQLKKNTSETIKHNKTIEPNARETIEKMQEQQ